MKKFNMAEICLNIEKMKVTELRNLCKRKSISAKGNKNELISRLKQHLISEKSVGEEFNVHDVGDNDKLENYENDVVVEEKRDYLLKMMELIEKEKDLLKRENDLLKKEIELKDKVEAKTETVNKNSDSQNDLPFINYYSALMSEYDGDNMLFSLWVEQILRIKDEYKISDRILKLLIVKNLKGKALNFYNSKPEHISMNFEELLSVMAIIFDSRIDRTELKRKLENRIWQQGESFIDYVQHKLSLANQLRLNEQDIIDYMIDGIPNYFVKTQVKMQMFKKVDDLITAMSQIKLPSERKPKFDKFVQFNKNKQQVTDDRKISKRPSCFNCGKEGHWSHRCDQPRRTWGSCFNCGQMGHRAEQCQNERKSLVNRSTINNVIFK